MPDTKNKFHILHNSRLQTVCILLLLLLAGLMLWFNNSCSYQAMGAIAAQVRFQGEYRVGDGAWQPIVEGRHIPATKGDVTLRGNFHMLTPDGEYVGIYSGETPVAFYVNHVNLTFFEGENEPYISAQPGA